MSLAIFTPKAQPVPVTEDLNVLFAKARTLGLVSLHSHDNGDISVRITLRTPQHTTVVGSSGYGHKAPAPALTAAIANTLKIMEAFK